MRLRLAIQKQGKLADGSVNLLRGCGVVFSNGNGKLRVEAENFPLEIFFLRDDDIPQYVADGVADIGIVGENIIAEQPAAVEQIEKLGFGHCRLSIAVPKSSPIDDPRALEGKRIATAYPRILGQFLSSRGISAEIHPISGSVEIAPSIGLADAICDLVSSGNTLFSNGLRETVTILESEAVLIARPDRSADCQSLVDKLVFRIRSVLSAGRNKYILLNAPEEKTTEISRLLPGMRSPTVVPLAEAGWVSIHSVIAENDFWTVIDDLKNAGAEGILVLAIDQMIA
ncbi:MAG: ATP phosphoribosyltransferase [Blastocatellia bacterium]